MNYFKDILTQSWLEKLNLNTNTRYINCLYNFSNNTAKHYEADAQYNDYFEKQESLWQLENDLLRTTVIKAIETKNKNILDVGCGTAWAAERLCTDARLVVSMDLSTINPQKAVAKYPFDNHLAVSCEIEKNPFKHTIFDCIICTEVLEHVPQPEAFINVLSQLLTQDGILVFTTPYNEKIQHSTCIHCNRETPHNAHLHSIDLPKIKHFAEATNLSIDTIFCFSNKLLLIFRVIKLYKFIPHNVYIFIDKTVNMLFNKPARVLFILKKKS